MTELKVTNPEWINCDKKDTHYEDFTKGMGDGPGEIGTWGFNHLFKSIGYWNTCNQYIVALTIPKDCQELDQIEKEIVAIVPHLKPVSDGLKMIKIFEHTQSEFGTYEIGYDDTDWYLVRHVHGDVSKKKQKSLKALLGLIRKKHYSE